jgi:hypothetical protein
MQWEAEESELFGPPNEIEQALLIVAKLSRGVDTMYEGADAQS